MSQWSEHSVHADHLSTLGAGCEPDAFTLSVPSPPARAKHHPFMERFIDKLLVMPNGCWEWTASKDPKGYGRFVGAGGKKQLRAHRVAYELFIGPIPAEMQIDHLCRNRGCVNPSHLEVVTPRENTLRGLAPTAENARKACCIRGHALADDNLLFDSIRGWRGCRECKNANRRALRARRLTLLQRAFGIGE